MEVSNTKLLFSIPLTMLVRPSKTKKRGVNTTIVT